MRANRFADSREWPDSRESFQGSRTEPLFLLRESFCESGEGVRLPRERADLRGSPGTSGKFGELPGKFGELPGNLRIAVKFHSERTSGEVAENFRGSPGTSQKLGGA